MKQITFNIYFTVSFIFIVLASLLAITDTERNLIDNSGFLSVLLLSLINLIYAIYLYFQVPE